MRRLQRNCQPRLDQTEVARNKMVRSSLARFMLTSDMPLGDALMRCRFSPQAGLSEQNNEPMVLTQDNSLDLVARFLELKRLRHEVRIAQCGRVSLWDELASVEKSPKRGRVADKP
jgi:hypothetical protein